MGTVAVLIMAFFLSIYRANKLPVPLGWDTSRYLWRTSLVKAFGIADLPRHVPIDTNADPGRPAFPIIALALSSILHVGTFQIAAVLPGVMAAVIGLAAGAFVAVTLRRPTWELVVTALFIGMSAFVVRLAGPETYQDNLFATAVFMAAAIPISLSVTDGRALLPAILLFGAGGVVHWAFLVFMLGAIGLAALAYAPLSWRRWRSGDRSLWQTPSTRLAAVGLGGAAIAGGTIYAVLSAGTKSPRLSRSEFAKKLRKDLPKYKFPITLPIAAIGAASLAFASGKDDDEAERSRSVLILLLSWSGVALAGLIGFKVAHLRIPAHRFLAFALAVPVLAVIGLLWVARLVRRRAAAPAALIVVASLVGAAWISHVVWFRNQTWMDPAKIKDAANATAYLDAAHVSTERPIVVIVNNRDSSYTALMAHMIRTVLPPDRIDDLYLYVGSPENYLAERPTPAPDGGPSALSDRYFARMRSTYEADPVALTLWSFDDPYFEPWAAANPQSVVAPHVAVVKGPLLPAALPPAAAPLGGLGSLRVGLMGVGSLACLAAIGFGWSLLLLGRWLRAPHVLAVSPAVGVAALVLGGILFDRSGFRLSGAVGTLAPAAISAAGWAAAWLAPKRAPTRQPP
jgi:hypothetical protein